jgi:23S rRNA (cytidine1920-2'-O)/16S rRNA (cytidine1409-2'-O)-methyltransferase
LSAKIKKCRLDMLLVEKGLAPSQDHAARLIMSGCVYTDNRRLDKAGELLKSDCPLTVKPSKPHQWVSRGGTKLAHGLDYFQIDPRGMTALDIGASTGGFTDVLLHHGARTVFAVDVGYNELAWKLRQDARVVVCERLNARSLTKEHITEPIDIIVCDASFIGLQTVLPVPMQFAAPGAWMVALIKPQFEVQREQVGEKGIITDPLLHQESCKRIAEWLASCEGWSVIGITPSPIKGMGGNTEFLIGARYHG